MAKDSWGKVKNFLGLEIEDEYDDEEEEIAEDEIEDEVEYEDKGIFNKKTKKESSKVMNDQSKNSKVLVVEPEFFNDAPEICDNLRNNKTVVVNLEGTDYEEGRKIFDFLNGAVYALDGTIQKISENVFILAPKCVDVIAENIDTDTTREFLSWDYEK